MTSTAYINSKATKYIRKKVWQIVIGTFCFATAGIGNKNEPLQLLDRYDSHEPLLGMTAMNPC